MTSEERERLNTLCELIQRENDPKTFTKLLGELDQLLEKHHIEAKPPNK
jgi:hypothetical protein